MFTRALARRYPVLAIRNFRLLLADRVLAPMAYAFSMVGVSFAVLAVTATHAHPGGSTADLSYVLAAQIAPALVFLLIGGVIADRIAPQRLIIAANLMIALGESTFGIMFLVDRSGLSLPLMVGLETLTGAGMALFYPPSTALLPRLVPADRLQEANAISRLGMNGGTMAGAALAGLFVAAVGPGWALAVCGIGMVGTVPLMLAIRLGPVPRGTEHVPSVLRELREGWSEFRSHTWLWATVLQFTVVLAAWAGGFQVLGPAVANRHLGGASAWGLISAAEATGLIVGGIISLRWRPARPVRFVALIGGLFAVSPLALALVLPLPLICLSAFGLGIAIETMAVTWSVTMATKIPADRLARVSAYDALGSVMGMPLGTLAAGVIAQKIGVSATQFGAAAVTLLACGLVLLSREVRQTRWTDALESVPSGKAVLTEPIVPVAPAVPVESAVLVGAGDADASLALAGNPAVGC